MVFFGRKPRKMTWLRSTSIGNRCGRCRMTNKKVVWTSIAVAAAGVLVLLLLLRAHRLRLMAERQSVPIEGAVIKRDADTQNELPITDVEITASDGATSATTRSDAAGHFKLVVKKRVLSEQPIPSLSVIRVTNRWT